MSRSKPLRLVIPLPPFVPRRWSKVKETYTTARADERTPESVARSDNPFPLDSPKTVQACRMPQSSVQYGPGFRSTPRISHRFRSSTSSLILPGPYLRHILPALRLVTGPALVYGYVTTLHHNLRDKADKSQRTPGRIGLPHICSPEPDLQRPLNRASD